jgi:hypothetical protein
VTAASTGGASGSRSSWSSGRTVACIIRHGCPRIPGET